MKYNTQSMKCIIWSYITGKKQRLTKNLADTAWLMEGYTYLNKQRLLYQFLNCEYWTFGSRYGWMLSLTKLVSTVGRSFRREKMVRLWPGWVACQKNLRSDLSVRASMSNMVSVSPKSIYVKHGKCKSTAHSCSWCIIYPHVFVIGSSWPANVVRA